jgi:hypothetical protein
MLLIPLIKRFHINSADNVDSAREEMIDEMSANKTTRSTHHNLLICKLQGIPP